MSRIGTQPSVFGREPCAAVVPRCPPLANVSLSDISIETRFASRKGTALTPVNQNTHSLGPVSTRAPTGVRLLPSFGVRASGSELRGQLGRPGSCWWHCLKKMPVTKYSISFEFREKLLVVCMAALDSKCATKFCRGRHSYSYPRMVHRDVGLGPGSNYRVSGKAAT